MPSRTALVCARQSNAIMRYADCARVHTVEWLECHSSSAVPQMGSTPAASTRIREQINKRKEDFHTHPTVSMKFGSVCRCCCFMCRNAATISAGKPHMYTAVPQIPSAIITWPDRLHSRLTVVQHTKRLFFSMQLATTTSSLVPRVDNYWTHNCMHELETTI